MSTKFRAKKFQNKTLSLKGKNGLRLNNLKVYYKHNSQKIHLIYRVKNQSYTDIFKINCIKRVFVHRISKRSTDSVTNSGDGEARMMVCFENFRKVLTKRENTEIESR